MQIKVVISYKKNTPEVGIRSTLVPIGTSEKKILGTGYWPDFQYADLWTTQWLWLDENLAVIFIPLHREELRQN